jgi:heme-degrading monooxygenase HmoA
MVGVIVRFSFGEDFDAAKVTSIADGARERFEGMPRLRNKFFTVDEENREAVNFYVWESEEAARAFFDDELLERVTGLYGVRPTLEFVEVAALVDNS